MPKDKTLKDAAIKIKGKDYVMVKDRVAYFNDTYPGGMITADLLTEPDNELIVFKARVTPDHTEAKRYFVGHSQAIVGGLGVNATSALENAETSAIGRALAMMGIGVLDSVASADEVNKAITAPQRTIKPVSPKQLDWLRKEAQKVSGYETADDLDKWIESVLTVDPNKLPGFKTVDAVDLIRAQKEPPKPDADPVITDIPADINLDNVAY